MTTGFKDRVRAFLIHFSISAVIGLSIAALLLGFWFPKPYGDLVGGTKLFFLILGIDVILGPCLTFVVFNRAKRSLRFDLSVIALLQLSALSYGVHIAAEARIVFLVLTKHVAYITTANMIEPNDLKKAAPQFSKLSWTGPQWVVGTLPTDPSKQLALGASAAVGKDINTYPEYFSEYAAAAPAILAEAKPIAQLLERAPEYSEKIQTLLANANLRPEDARYVALRGRNPLDDITLILSARDGQVAGAVAVDPWTTRH